MPIGFHVSKASDGGKRTMLQALKEDMEMLKGFELDPCAQIFVSGPQSFKETVSDGEALDIKDYMSRAKIPLVIHGAYVDNPWSGSEGTIHNIKQELRKSEILGAEGVIIHLSSAALDSCVDVLQKLNGVHGTVWLEINAAKPTPLTFETPQKIAALFDKIRGANNIERPDRIGLCIDTAHLYSCGVSFEKFDAADQWLRALPNVPMMLHLNDSASKLGSGVDKHESLCRGNIWREYGPDGALPFDESGLAATLLWAENRSIFTVLERDDPVHDLTMIRDQGFFLKN